MFLNLIKKVFISFIFIGLVIFENLNLAYAVDVPYQTYGFFDQSGKERKVKLKVIGKVVEVKNNKKGLLARLFQENLTRKGDRLYILNRSGLIIGQLNVKYVFTTLYFGQMLSGLGFFRLIPIDSLIAKRTTRGSKAGLTRVLSYIAKAENFYHEKSMGEAIRYYKKALTIDPENPKGLLGLGECYFSQGLWEASGKSFEKAYSLRQNLISREDLVDLYLYLANLSVKKAQRILSASKIDRKKKRMHLSSASAFIREGLLISQKSVTLNYYAGRIYYTLGNHKKALIHLRKSIHKGGQYLFDCYWLISRIFTKRGLKGKAYTFLLKAKEIKPFDPRINEEIQKLGG